MRFAANAVWLQLHALADNLADVLRTPVKTVGIETWSLTSLRERLTKTGTRHQRHARYAESQFAEAAQPRQVLVGIVALLNGLRGSPAVTVSTWPELVPDRWQALARGDVRPDCR